MAAEAFEAFFPVENRVIIQGYRFCRANVAADTTLLAFRLIDTRLDLQQCACEKIPHWRRNKYCNLLRFSYGNIWHFCIEMIDVIANDFDFFQITYTKASFICDADCVYIAKAHEAGTYCIY